MNPLFIQDKQAMSAWLAQIMPGPALRSIEQVDLLAEASDTVARLWLHYPAGNDDPALPLSLIVKLPSQDATRRHIADTYHLFEREIFFYAHVGPHCPIAAPACHYASIEEKILLLEDAGCHATGDQESGYQPAEAQSVVRQLAQFHTRWLHGASRLETVPAIDQPSIVAGLPAMVKQVWEQCYPLVKHAIPPAIHNAVLKLIPQIPLLAQQLCQPPYTLLHGDLRMENILFEGMEAKCFLDWQLLARGSPMVDIAYFLTQSGAPEHRRQIEPFAIQHYAQLLQPFHITEQRLWEDYRKAALYSLIVPIFGMAVDLQQCGTVRPLVYSAFDRLACALEDLRIAL